MKNSRVLLLLFASILLIFPAAKAAPVTTGTPLISGTISRVATVNVSTLPDTAQLQALTGRAPLHSQGQQAFDQAKAQASQPGSVPADESTKTVTNAPSLPAPLTVTLGLVLEGAVGASPNPCGCTPPDGAVGVGPTDVFSMVNTAGIIYTKTGTLVRGTFALDSFFGVPGHSLSDPQVSFDTGSGRWFTSIIDVSTNNIQIAVSTSNDPTGTFNVYTMTDPNHLPDQPVTGTNDDKYVVSVNDFNTAGTSFIGVHYFVLNKAQLVAGNPTISTSQNTPDPNMFSLHPAEHLTSSTTFYLATDCTGSCVTSPSSTTTTETVISLTGVPPGTVTSSSSSFSISTSSIGPNAAQPGTSTTLNTDDNRLESAVWESNTLWTAWTDACVPSGDTQTRTCLRLVQATTSGSTATKNQDFDFAANAAYYFYPAVSSHNGDLVVSFGESSSSVFPSALVTGRAASDPANTLQAPATARAGSADDTSTRYGDYNGAAADPNPTSTSTFWVEAEYRKSSTFQNWNTVISQVGAFSGGGGAQFDFSLSLNPSSGSVQQGSGTTSTVTVTLVSGTTQTVTLSTSISPSATGLTATVTPTSGSPTYTSTLSISTTTSTPTGSYTVTVSGTNGTLTHSTNYALTVTAPPPPDFSISASPSSLRMARLGSTSTTITVTSLNGFSGTVSLTATAVTGVGETFSPGSITITSGGSGTSTLTFTGSSSDSRGTFTVTITGTSGSITHTTTVTLTISKH